MMECLICKSKEIKNKEVLILNTSNAKNFYQKINFNSLGNIKNRYFFYKEI